MEAGEAEISRIIRCTVSRKELVFRFSPGEQYTILELRKRYKSLALLVHPDRCKIGGAESAFQILSNSFEILLSQIPDSNTVIHEGKIDSRSDVTMSSQKQKSNASNSSNEANPNADDRNENDRSAKRSDHTSWTNRTTGGVRTSADAEGGRRKRSSTFNFGAEWARVEEEFLTESLAARVSHEIRLKRKKLRRNEADDLRASNLQAEAAVQLEHVESRADKWRKWSLGSKVEKSTVSGGVSSIEDPAVSSNNSDNHNGCDKSNSNSNEISEKSSVSNNSGDSNCSNSNDINSDNSDRSMSGDIALDAAESTGKNRNTPCHNQSYPVCLICRRMFRTSIALQRHLEVSTLHLSNILMRDDASKLTK